MLRPFHFFILRIAVTRICYQLGLLYRLLGLESQASIKP